MCPRLLQSVALFPRAPGVYLFKDAKGEVLYVGKAKHLRDRVQGYFAPGRDCRPQIAFLLKRAAEVGFIVTDTEQEALLLENTLIKEHRPRYNVSLKDDKGYLSIQIGKGHPFPGISLARRVRKEGALSFGPYDSAAAAREAVEILTKFFFIRSCRDAEFANRVRPCLKHDIGRCSAPCVGLVSKEEYAVQLEEALLFLRGERRHLLRLLREKMRGASAAERYEEAARWRDAVGMLRGLLERQKAVRHGGGDADAVGLAVEGDRRAICVFSVRGGVLRGSRVWRLPRAAGDDGKVLEEFLLARYREGAEIPPKILLSHPVEGPAALEGILGERGGKSIAVRCAGRGEAARLVLLAQTNAKESLAGERAETIASELLHRLGRRLGLAESPERIEGIDVSNLGGRDAVGSLVSFLHGLPDKANYRLYNIRTLATPDDYGMMRELLSRRFRDEPLRGRGAALPPDRPPPDLLLVDGGKGQLAVAERVLKELGLSLPLAAIAKGEKKGHADRIYLPGRKNHLGLKRGSKELLLLMRIRDEAHRFGIRAHRRRRIKGMLGRKGLAPR